MDIDQAELSSKKRNTRKLCEGLNCPYQKEHYKKKWSWSHFFIGLVNDIKTLIFSPEIWVFVITTIIYIIFADKKDLGSWIAYISLGGAFMFYKPLSSLISNGKLNVDTKFGASISKELK